MTNITCAVEELSMVNETWELQLTMASDMAKNMSFKDISR